MVVPSCAVTTVVMAFGPTFNIIGPDAVPDVTVVPFTVTVDVFTVVVGVMVIVETVLATLSVYAVVVAENAGDKGPGVGFSASRFASVDLATVTTKV